MRPKTTNVSFTFFVSHSICGKCSNIQFIINCVARVNLKEVRLQCLIAAYKTPLSIQHFLECKLNQRKFL